jgi:hypothetical protein
MSSGYDEDEDEDGDNDKNDNLVLPYWNEGKDHAFVHQFGDALSFLRMCRQVHQEASGVFYGKNLFVISQVPLVDANGKKLKVCVPGKYQPLVYAQ